MEECRPACKTGPQRTWPSSDAACTIREMRKLRRVALVLGAGLVAVSALGCSDWFGSDLDRYTPPRAEAGADARPEAAAEAGGDGSDGSDGSSPADTGTDTGSGGGDSGGDSGADADTGSDAGADARSDADLDAADAAD